LVLKKKRKKKGTLPFFVILAAQLNMEDEK